jgi:hypothetical protein
MTKLINHYLRVQLNDESDDLNIIDGGGAWLDRNPMMGDEEDRISFEVTSKFL